VYAAQKNRGLEIIGLSVDNLSPSDLKQFVRKAKINYPIALATEDIIRSFQPGEYIPTTIFIDKQGRIRHKHVGQLEKETLLTIFNQLSAEK
jgi:peroxiredoxin